VGLDEEESGGEEGFPPARRHYQPAWAGELRALYNAVVEEPLPDSFADLLAKLDGPSSEYSPESMNYLPENPPAD
jgi:hypothetical protein